MLAILSRLKVNDDHHVAKSKGKFSALMGLTYLQPLVQLIIPSSLENFLHLASRTQRSLFSSYITGCNFSVSFAESSSFSQSQWEGASKFSPWTLFLISVYSLH